MKNEMEKQTKQWFFMTKPLIVVAILFLIDISSSVIMNFGGALEKTDKDGCLYTEQLQNLIVGKQTEMLFPLYRAFIPMISIGVSAILKVTYRNSMIIINVLFLMIWVIYFLKRMQGKLSYALAILVLSTPVVILYSMTCFLEIPFYLFLIISFFEWDEYCCNKKLESYLWVMISCVFGVLTKESFLVHLVIMCIFVIIFYYKKIMELLFPASFLVGVILAVYYINYEILFGMKKTLIINPILTNTIQTNLKPFQMERIVNYFTVIKGGFFHSMINLGLAFGVIHILVFKMMKELKDKWQYWVYFSILLGLLIIININVNTAQKYAFLCFGPTYFLLIAKNGRDLVNKPDILVKNYTFNMLLVACYSLIKNMNWNIM